MQNSAPPQLMDALKRHKYHIIGNHSAVKRCRWFHHALVNNRSCYKQKFYGVESHRCIQMTPSLFNCTQQCLFCWRAQNGDLQLAYNETKMPEWDSPERIVEGCLHEQSRILNGYKGNEKTDMQKFEEAHTPKNVAISLAGEPTLYDPLGDLIEAFHERGLTTFLVSNGTMPSKLSKLSEEPTQLYISGCAPNEEIFQRVCRPQIPGAWQKLNETLALLQSFSCPTVIRMTLVRGRNMDNMDGYAKLVEKAYPTYIEAKAYMHVGFSSLRLDFDSMPNHKEIYDFATCLAEKTGYNIIDQATDSRVVLLSKREKPIRFSASK